MSVRDSSPKPERAVLKPYSGAGAPLLQRYAPYAVALVAAIFCFPYGFFYALTTPWLLVPFMVPPAILMMIVIWAAPESKTVPVPLMERLFFALFVGFVMWPNYLAISLPGLPWITVNRLIGTPLALIFLVSLSSNGAFRQQVAAILQSTPIFWKALLVMIGMEFISLPFSPHTGGTIAQLIVVQTNETIPFLLGCFLFVRPGRARYAAYLLWLMSVGLCLMGLLEEQLHHPLWAGHIPSFLRVGNDMVSRILNGSIRNTTGQYRVQTVFSTPLGLSEYLGIATPFVFDLALSKKSATFVKIAAGATLPLILVVLLGTDSRFGLMVYFLSAMLYLLSWALVHRRRAHSLLGTAIVMAYPALFATGIAASMFVGRIRAKVWGTGQYNDSTQARIDQFNLAFPKLFTHPLGYGLGAGAEAIGYRTPSGLLSVDSFYLNLIMELGSIGLIAFITMFSYLSIRSIMAVVRSYDEDSEVSFLMPGAISLIAFLVIKLVFAQEDNHPLVFVIASMVAALLYRHDLGETRDATARPVPAGRRARMIRAPAGGAA
jgi:hypothetical protein